jgi:hypothetical protein
LPRLLLPKDIYPMLKWFAVHDFEANIMAIKLECAQLTSFRAWLAGTQQQLLRTEVQAVA